MSTLWVTCIQDCKRCGFKDWCDMLHEKGLADFDKKLFQSSEPSPSSTGSEDSAS